MICLAFRAWKLEETGVKYAGGTVPRTYVHAILHLWFHT